MRRTTAQSRLDRFKGLLKIVKAEEIDTNSPIFQRALAWLREFPTELSKAQKDDLRDQLCEAFKVTHEELLKLVAPETKPSVPSITSDSIEDELELWKRIPEEGFFRHYCEYTAHAEGPLAFHLFSAMCIVGSVIGRRVWFNMGYYKVFPNLSVVLLGRSGVVRKTTTTNIAVGLLQKLGVVKIYSEKTTPESLVDAMKESASGLIYVPEFSVFLGRQKYIEGMVPLLTRLLDNPDVWESSTIGRGRTLLKDVALSMLGASTLDWFIRATPEDTFGGGFINRLFLVIQEDTPREEAIPEPPGEEEERRLIAELACFKEAGGDMKLSDGALSAWRGWYHEQREQARAAENDTLTNYAQRRPDRILKVAMLLHLSRHHDRVICEQCLSEATNLVTWSELSIPNTVKKMFQTQEGEEQQFVLNMIEKLGGLVDHSTLVRRCQYKMNAMRLASICRSLAEARSIKAVHDATGHYYCIMERKDG